MITKITAAYTRYYRDNCQLTAYIEWVDSKGKAGRTEGAVKAAVFRPDLNAAPKCMNIGHHMQALLDRAAHEGITLEHQTW